ncbi:hypothetical protein MMC25_003307 [Agyrium rufum]|nr:hypothetical protein [Agyrium rufum]
MGNSPSQILASSDGSTDDDHAHQLVLQAEQLAQDALEGFYAKKLKIASTPSSSYPPQKILSHVNYVRTIPCLATFVQDERTIEEGIKVAVSSYVGQEGVRTSSIQNGLEAITRSAVGSLLREASPGRKLTKEK